MEDAAASFRRIFKVNSPTSGTFYNRIVGADACIKTPATCKLAGGVVADAKTGTLPINLSAPDAEFFEKIAFPHAVILPADAPAKTWACRPSPARQGGVGQERAGRG